MRVTTLAENTARPGLESEHGLSLYVETGRQKLLFDTGPGDILLRNAEKLGTQAGWRLFSPSTRRPRYISTASPRAAITSASRMRTSISA